MNFLFFLLFFEDFEASGFSSIIVEGVSFFLLFLLLLFVLS